VLSHPFPISILPSFLRSSRAALLSHALSLPVALARQDHLLVEAPVALSLSVFGRAPLRLSLSAGCLSLFAAAKPLRQSGLSLYQAESGRLYNDERALQQQLLPYP